MKKLTAFIAFLSISAMLCAQVKVYKSGNVSIKSKKEAQSYLCVGDSAGTKDVALTATGRKDGAYFLSTSNNTSQMFDNWNYGLRADVHVIRNMHAAIDARATSPQPTGCRAIGVRGVAGNATAGYNFGVFGLLWGERDGAAVYGTTDNTDWGAYIGAGKYAGFFRGDVKSTGTMTATSFITPSDLAYKNNIQPLSSKPTALVLLSELNPVVYNLKEPDRELKKNSAAMQSDTVETPVKYFNEQSAEFQKKHYGLIAQELQSVLPDLVYENAEGLLGINYIELIPLLVQAMKEQQLQIEELQLAVQALQADRAQYTAAYDDTNVDKDKSVAVASLEQNRPNPFSEKTVIGFSLPETVKNAELYIYDLNGRQIDKIGVASRGKSEIEIPANRLSEGMYIYTLLADDVVVGSKRMIITK